jgi:thymidylate synthase (FAD)
VTEEATPEARRVLDRGWVRLEEHLGGEGAVLEAGRICYQSESKGPAHDARLLGRLLTAGHNTPFEHAVYRFRLKVPLFVRDHFVRHRLCSFNIKSLRYCVAEREYYIPERTTDTDTYVAWRRAGGAATMGDEERRAYTRLPAGQAAYVQAMETQFDAYERLAGVGWPPERARLVLGTAVYTEMLWTINCWSLFNVFGKRLDHAAQRETRQYAQALWALWAPTMPRVAAVFRDLHAGLDYGEERHARP